MLGVFETWAMSLPLDQVNAVWQKFGGLITPNMIAHECLASFTMFVALGFTLPIRSIAWTLWYDNLNALTNTEEKPAKKKRKTKQKKLDKNVLKRAMEDDDEE